MIDERTEWLLDHRKRKITRDMGFPVYLVPVDEVAYFSATKGTTGSAEGVQRRQPRRGRPRPRPGHHRRGGHPAALGGHHPHRPCGTCSATGGRSAAPPKPRSDTILGHGWASKGYTAEDIDPQARGVSWLRAEDGLPRKVKAAYLTDEQIITLADQAAALRRQAKASKSRDTEGGNVVPLRGDDAA